MKGCSRFLNERNKIVARQHRVATEFDTSNRHLVSRVYHLNARQLFIRLASRSYGCPLAIEELVTVGILEFANNRILLAWFVILAFEEDGLSVRVLSREWRFHSAGYVFAP